MNFATFNAKRISLPLLRLPARSSVGNDEAYIGVQKSHVNLGFYHGASLNDPGGLLEGTGKKLRHVKVRNVTEAENPALKGLVVEAIAERRRCNDKVQQRGST